MLDRLFTHWEVETVVFSMGPLKAPGPDGFPTGFYQKYWDVIGPSVPNYVLAVLNQKMIIKEINHTFLVLIPKTKDPNEPSQYRPISLCNVLYKIVAKVLDNRIKMVLPKLIAPNQATFISGRLIQITFLSPMSFFTT